MKELKEILDMIRLACMEVRINPSHDMQLDCAVRIFNSPNNNRESKPNFEKQNKPIVPASIKQINYLKSLGYKGDLNLSSKEAYNMIQQLKNKEQ